MSRYRILLLVILLFSFFPATSSAQAAMTPLPGLSVSGTNIVANGQPIRLRGVNMGDPFWARNPDWYPNLSLADYGTLSQVWHANVVRISVFPTQWKTMDHATLINSLSQQIDAALNNKMYVILSYHVIGWPDGYYQQAYSGNPYDTYDSSMTVATSFWTAMAQAYGSDTRIIFDLWNEPVYDSNDYVGSDPNPLWPTLKGYYETLIQTVRNNGGQNIVIATGNRWASWLVGIKDNPLADSNVIYAYHKYSVNGSNTASVWDKDTGGLIGVKPVIVSEWGYEDSDVTNPTWSGSQASYGDAFVQWMESHNLSNLAWMYHYDWTPALIKADGSLTLYGAFVKNYIQSHNSLNAISPTIAGCLVFPTNNVWNTPIDKLPVDTHSSTWVNSIGAGTGLHMDFGSGIWNGGPIGIPYNLSDNTIAKYTFSFLYADESDSGPYPVPNNAAIEYGSDHHLLVLDQSTCKLYETWDTTHNSNGTWSAGSGAIWDLNSNMLRPAGWTSADAAGLPILPGLIRYDEIASGYINHAIRFTASSTNSYIWPARHLTSGSPGVLTSTPPMGARFRLKASFNTSGYPVQLQVILQAMKTYGIILADNGSNWYISGAPDPRWDNDMLHMLDNLTGNNFEAVNSSSLMISPDSGATSVIMLTGNAGTAGVVLSYTDSVTSQADGSYSLSVPYNWSGTVTPSHACFTFNPVSKTYANVTTNQTQDYVPSFKAASGCADIGVTIGGVPRGEYGLLSQGSQRVTYALDSGPVKVASTNAVNLIAALRDAWLVNGQVTSFAQLMGLPKEQLADTYYFPAYNNVTLSEQLRIANVDTVATDVTVTIAGIDRGTYHLNPSESVRPTYPLDAGPVVVHSSGGTKIIAALRDAWLVNGQVTSFVQLMGLPQAALSDTYYFPAYNNVTLSGQLRIGNVDTVATDVTVTIAGVDYGPYHLNPHESVRPTYPLDAGPVIVHSSGNVKIIAALRDAWLVNGNVTSFAQLMGLPKEKLSDTYLFPAYNNVTLSGQLRLANVDTVATDVTITIAGVDYGPYHLNPGDSVRPTYPLDAGPVVVHSSGSVKIIAALRDAWLSNGQVTSFVQLMGLPKEALSTAYFFPAYNNLTLSGQLRFGVP